MEMIVQCTCKYNRSQWCQQINLQSLHLINLEQSIETIFPVVHLNTICGMASDQ